MEGCRYLALVTRCGITASQTSIPVKQLLGTLLKKTASNSLYLETCSARSIVLEPKWVGPAL